MKEKVNHPEHYNNGNTEAIEVIEDWNLDFHLGNAVKYICRAPYKGNYEEDIKKAIWYLQRSLSRRKKDKVKKTKEKYNIQLSHFVNQGESK